MAQISKHVLMETVNCNLCGSDSARKFMKVDGFNIVKCRRCGLVFVNPRLKFNQLAEIYMDGTYYKNPSFNSNQNGASLYGYEDYLKDEEEILKTFARRLDTIEKYSNRGKLLDVGCGLGFFLKLASERGWKVNGVEISKLAADFVKKRHKLPVFNGTLAQANFKKGYFDAITLFDVIEHIPDPKSMLLQANELLKPNGLLAVTTPNIGSLSARILGTRWEEVKRVREHIYFFSEKTLKSMLRSAGYKVIKTESAGRFFPVKGAVNRLKTYSHAASKVAEKVADCFNLNDRSIYVDPHYKVTIYSRKM